MSIDEATAAEWDALNRAALMTPTYVTKGLKEPDSINPSHYKGNGIECIDYMKERLDIFAFLGYLNGNVIKYMHRWEYKNGIEDLRKARWYLDRLIEEEEGRPK
jgi:hypothetical protein